MSGQRQVARRASLIAAAILAGAAVGGDWLLRKLGISLAAFRIAGGLLLFSIASETVLGVRIERQSETAEQALEEHVRNVAASPLAIPLRARRHYGDGPASRTGHRPTDLHRDADRRNHRGVRADVTVFYFATRIARFLGVTGNIVLSCRRRSTRSAVRVPPAGCCGNLFWIKIATLFMSSNCCGSHSRCSIARTIALPTNERCG